MNNLNVNVLAEAKHEYTSQLLKILVSQMYLGIKSMYTAAKEWCKKTGEKNTLKKFQLILKTTPEWDDKKIENEYERISIASECDYIEDLITAIFVSHMKILTAIKIKTNHKKIEMDVPTGSYFMHKAYIECARNFWKYPYLFHTDFQNIDIQRNLQKAEDLIKDSIIETIRNLLPVKDVLREYLGNDYDDEEDADITSLISNSTKKNIRKMIKFEIEASGIETTKKEDNEDINDESRSITEKNTDDKVTHNLEQSGGNMESSQIVNDNQETIEDKPGEATNDNDNKSLEIKDEDDNKQEEVIEENETKPVEETDDEQTIECKPVEETNDEQTIECKPVEETNDEQTIESKSVDKKDDEVILDSNEPLVSENESMKLSPDDTHTIPDIDSVINSSELEADLKNSKENETTSADQTLSSNVIPINSDDKINDDLKFVKSDAPSNDNEINDTQLDRESENKEKEGENMVIDSLNKDTEELTVLKSVSNDLSHTDKLVSSDHVSSTAISETPDETLPIENTALETQESIILEQSEQVNKIQTPVSFSESNKEIKLEINELENVSEPFQGDSKEDNNIIDKDSNLEDFKVLKNDDINLESDTVPITDTKVESSDNIEKDGEVSSDSLILEGGYSNNDTKIIHIDSQLNTKSKDSNEKKEDDLNLINIDSMIESGKQPEEKESDSNIKQILLSNEIEDKVSDYKVSKIKEKKNTDNSSNRLRRFFDNVSEVATLNYDENKDSASEIDEDSSIQSEFMSRIESINKIRESIANRLEDDMTQNEEFSFFEDAANF